MYLTAHRVVSPSGAQGFNAFYHVHNTAWTDTPPGSPEDNPGELVSEHVEVALGGNRVRSYLDVLAPDDATPTELTHGFLRMVTEFRPDSLPATFAAGHCSVGFGMERSLAARWRGELHQLFMHCLTVWGR
jgi:hypothetical protein